MHNPGKHMQGIANHDWRHGRFSEHLPQGMQELAQNAVLADLYNLDDLVLVYQVRIQTALRELETGGGWERLKAIQDAWEEFEEATAGQEPAAYARAVNTLKSLIRPIGHDWMLWKDIDVAAKNLKLLMESERKRQIEAHALIPTVKATAFARELVLAVRSEITDPEVLKRIQAKVTEALGGYPSVVENDAEA